MTISDDAWSGSALTTNEGTSIITFLASFAAGTQFNYDANRTAGLKWAVGTTTTNLSDVTSTNFALNASGDNLFAYNGSTAPTSGGDTNWVAAFAANAFVAAGAQTTSLTALPSAFTLRNNAFTLNLAPAAANENGVEALTSVVGSASQIRSKIYSSTWTTYTTAATQVPPATTFTIGVVNDAPTGANNTVTTLEDTPYTFATTDFGFSDPNDNPANSLLAVVVATLPGAGSLTDNGVAVTAGQFIAVADITGGLLTFTPSANGNGTAYSSFTFQVQDNGGTANGGADTDPSPKTMTVNVTSVNDAPQGANATVSTTTNISYTFTAANFGFTDPNDNPANSFLAVKITTAPAVGTLADNGVAVTAGQSIAVADITGGLLTFTPATNASGSPYTSFTFQVQDNGGTANGGVDTDPSAKTMTINVSAVVIVNHAPTGSNGTVSTTEDTAYTFATSDFGFSDPNDSTPNTLLAVKITTLPAVGSLKDNGVSVSAGQFVRLQTSRVDLLTFTPATHATGSPYTSFTFQVQDNGGNGPMASANLDPTPKTLTVEVGLAGHFAEVTGTTDATGSITSGTGTAANPFMAATLRRAAITAATLDGDNDIITFAPSLTASESIFINLSIVTSTPYGQAQ